MARPRLWRITRLTNAEVDARRRFILELKNLISANNIRERLRMDWDLFLELNLLTPTPQTLELFVADMCCSLKESTAAEYTSKLHSIPALKLTGMRGCLTRLIRLLNIRAADADTRRALSITHAQCSLVLGTLPCLERGALTMMALIGPRAKDVSRLRQKQIDIPHVRANREKGVFYRAEIRIAKNRKKLGRRASLWVPAEWRCPLLRDANYLHRYLHQFGAEERPFASCTTRRLNDALSVACREAGQPRMTTYSFRRLFITEVIRRCNRDFAKVRNYTLHFAEDTIRAFYDTFNLDVRD